MWVKSGEMRLVLCVRAPIYIRNACFFKVGKHFPVAFLGDIQLQEGSGLL